MGLLEDFEKSHLRNFAQFDSNRSCPISFKTPNGRGWRLNEVVIGWQPRISDHWSWAVLHKWIIEQQVKVMHVELPCPMVDHRRTDPVWQFIAREYGPVEYEATSIIGRADLIADGLLCEFGTCAPLKFVLAVGTHIGDHMIIPYEEKYGFVFRSTKALLECGTDFSATP